MIRILTNVYERPLLLSGVADKEQGGSHMRPEENFENEEEYLEGDYYGNQDRGDLKLMLENQKKDVPKKREQAHLDEDHRRAVVEGHHLGQYPPEGYEMEMDYDEDEDEEGYN